MKTTMKPDSTNMPSIEPSSENSLPTNLKMMTTSAAAAATPTRPKA